MNSVSSSKNKIVKTDPSLPKAILREPKKSCKRCYGRSIIGRNILKNKPVVCSCIFKNVVRQAQIKLENQFKIIGGFYRVFLGKNRRRKHN